MRSNHPRRIVEATTIITRSCTRHAVASLPHYQSTRRCAKGPAACSDRKQQHRTAVPRPALVVTGCGTIVVALCRQAGGSANKGVFSRRAWLALRASRASRCPATHPAAHRGHPGHIVRGTLTPPPPLQPGGSRGSAGANRLAVPRESCGRARGPIQRLAPAPISANNAANVPDMMGPIVT